MSLALVIPLSRPAMVARVLAQVAAQTSPSDVVVIVENGPAVGAVPPRSRCIVLRSAPSAGAARNAGITLARERGIEWVAFWDDDDTYFPGYLAEVRAAMSRDDVDVLAKSIGFVRLDGELYLFDNQRPTRCLLTNSLSVRASVAPLFREGCAGEDMVWTAEARARGLRERRLSPWHFVYERHAGTHSYTATTVQFLRTFGPCLHVLEPKDAPTVGEITRWVEVPLPTDGEVFDDLERGAMPHAVPP